TLHALGHRALFAVQDPPLGTGHALLQASTVLEADSSFASRRVLILSGDVPLTRPETLRKLIDEHDASNNALTLLTMKLDQPAMYGRIIRDDDGSVVRIGEAKEATEEQDQLRKLNER